MPDEVRLWRIEDGENLSETTRSALGLEARLQEWLASDISILGPDLLVIGREVPTGFGGSIDLLCLDRTGDIVVIELKRDKTPREVVAQALDYGSWVVDLSGERIASIAEAHLHGTTLEGAYERRFGTDLPETLNGGHRLLIVGSGIDASSERIIKYLSDTHGVNINAVTFQYFREANGSELLARVFLIEPSQVDLHSRTKGTSKRHPNLTYDKLGTLAEEAGVGELYRHAVSSFERYLQKHTTRSSIGFSAVFDGSRKNVLSLIPQQSDEGGGLRFQVYFLRLRTLLGVSEETGLALLPSRRDQWTYYAGAGPDYSGYQGFFASRDEIDRLAATLAESSKSHMRSH